ncbi:hypothetical protein LXL04_029484 [Taraxacum kok-saghyz]
MSDSHSKLTKSRHSCRFSRFWQIRVLLSPSNVCSSKVFSLLWGFRVGNRVPNRPVICWDLRNQISLHVLNPTKYSVEEVVTGVDETNLHRTWIKVVGTRNTRERSSKHENMCWRIWHLTHKKKQLLESLIHLGHINRDRMRPTVGNK